MGSRKNKMLAKRAAKTEWRRWENGGDSRARFQSNKRNRNSRAFLYDAVTIAHSCHKLTGRGVLFCDLAFLLHEDVIKMPQSNTRWVTEQSFFEPMGSVPRASEIGEILLTYKPESQAVVGFYDSLTPEKSFRCSLIENQTEVFVLSFSTPLAIAGVLCSYSQFGPPLGFLAISCINFELVAS